MGELKRYSMEIHYILKNLNEICEERYYERGTGDAKASTIAKNLREEFINLIKKIDKGEPSDWEGLFK